MSKFGLCWSFPAIESEVYYQRKLFDPWRKGMAVNRSLTVLLPVRDAQSTLAATVTQVLEMASDLSERFELLIIDDGSSDATQSQKLKVIGGVSAMNGIDCSIEPEPLVSGVVPSAAIPK